MTDITGRSFLSYRRTRREDAELMIAAQHDIGIPTWQDIQNLDEEPTETAIREVIGDRTIASAVLYLTPEVANSPMIRKVEAPQILTRHQRGDGFFVVPVAAGGLDYSGAAAVVDESISLDDLQLWNLRKVGSDPLNSRDAKSIAERVLRRRITAISEALPKEKSLRIVLNTRGSPSFELGTALIIDWSHRFQGREAQSEVWDEYLLPSLDTIIKTIQELAPGRSIEAKGLLSIPAAVALGYACLAPRQLRISWQQFTVGSGYQLWNIDSGQESAEFIVEKKDGKVDGEDLAVLVSVNADVESALATTRSELPLFRGFVHIRHPREASYLMKNPSQAAHVAKIVAEEIRKARTEFHLRGRIHLFMAVPAGLAMMIGQLLNTVGPVQTYEHIPTDPTGRYHPAALLVPK